MEETQEQKIDITALVRELMEEKIKVKMAVYGVKPEKIHRAVKLLDVSALVDEDTRTIDEIIFIEEMEELTNQFPELVKEESKLEIPQFKIGSDGEEVKKKGVSAIGKIFGNQEN